MILNVDNLLHIMNHDCSLHVHQQPRFDSDAAIWIGTAVVNLLSYWMQRRTLIYGLQLGHPARCKLGHSAQCFTARSTIWIVQENCASYVSQCVCHFDVTELSNTIVHVRSIDADIDIITARPFILQLFAMQDFNLFSWKDLFNFTCSVVTVS